MTAAAHPVTLTAQRLAALVIATRPYRAAQQLMPTGTSRRRSRVSCFDLTLRLRLRGHAHPEADVLAALVDLAALGCVDVDRERGGWAVVDWERLGEVAGGGR